MKHPLLHQHNKRLAAFLISRQGIQPIAADGNKNTGNQDETKGENHEKETDHQRSRL